jgi:replicative DNA helicase Mcm
MTNIDDCRAALEAVALDDLRDLRETYPDERVLDVDWQALARHALAEPVGLDEPVSVTPSTDDDLTLADVDGLPAFVISRPDSVFDALDAAARELDRDDRDCGSPMSRIHVSVTNLPDDATFSVGGFSPARWANSLVALEGQITKRTEVLPYVSRATFRCLGCGIEDEIEQPPYGPLREPHIECGCQYSPSWRMVDADRQDYQKVRLQQPPEEAQGETENIDIHLHGALAGDPRIEGGARTTFVATFEPVYTGTVVEDKTAIARGYTVEEGTLDDIDISAHADAIEEIASHPEPFRLLVEHVAPEHEGHEVEKAAITLQLLGGWSRVGASGARYRGDSHIYLLGDPGVGKSMLLKAIYERAPIAAITDGTGSSQAGLTAALVKDDFSDSQWAIEAGTLVRANRGIAAVDELDKGKTADLDALHTALEDQEVHVTKAGKNATLPAKTALLAAGNPTGGHFDPTKEFVEQVDLKSPLLSRFDLILTMRTEEDEAKIRDIADTMLRGANRAGRRARGEDILSPADETVSISAAVFRAYVAKAKQLQPVWRDEAVLERMREWFVETKTSLPERYQTAMGQGDYDGPPLPVTARKLMAVRRLAEASARSRLSEEIVMADVERVIPLVERSLADIGIAPRDGSVFGSVDADLDEASVGL